MNSFLKRISLLLAFGMIGIASNAQVLKRYSIGNSGCSVESYCPFKFDQSKSQDSSTVYAGECVEAGATYGVILVSLLVPRTDLDDAEELLLHYMDYLKSTFDIEKSDGYVRGATLRNNASTRGASDRWHGNDGNEWKVKGWTDGKHIAVLYVYGKRLPADAKTTPFLEGVRFSK